MPIHYEKAGPVAHIVLDNPPVNVFNPALHRDFLEILRDFVTDRSVHVGVWSAKGDRAFCAGDDIKTPRPARTATEQVERELGVRHDDEPFEYPGWENEVLAMTRYKPIVAAVNGHCLGQGFIYLMTLTDIRIASTLARFGLPEIKYGMGGAGGMLRLQKLIAPTAAMWMLLTGEPYDAQAALRYNIVNEVVEPERLQARAVEVAELIASHPPLAVRTEMEAYHRGGDMSRGDSLAFSQRLYRLSRLAMDQTPPLARGRDGGD